MSPNFRNNANTGTTTLLPSITFFFFASNSMGTLYRAYSRRDYYTIGFVVFEYSAFLLLDLCLTALHRLSWQGRSKGRKSLQLAVWFLYSAIVFGFTAYFAPLFSDPVYGNSLYVVSVVGSVFLFYVYVIWDDDWSGVLEEEKRAREVTVQVCYDSVLLFVRGHTRNGGRKEVRYAHACDYVWEKV